MNKSKLGVYLIHFELLPLCVVQSLAPQETSDRFIQVKEGLGVVSREMNSEAISHKWRGLKVESMKNALPVLGMFLRA